MTTRNRFIRNHVALSPLLRKGGAHTQSKTGQRVRSRLSTQDAIDEWYDEQYENEETNLWEVNAGESETPQSDQLAGC